MTGPSRGCRPEVLAFAFLLGLAACAQQSPLPSGASQTPGETAAATLSPGPSASASQDDRQTAPPAGIVRVLVDALRMRAAPQPNAEVVATLHKGQLVPTTGTSEAGGGYLWLEVEQQPSGRSGWIAGADADGNPWLASVKDGPIAIVSFGEDVRLIEPETSVETPITHGMRINDLAFSPDGTQIAIIDQSGPRMISASAVTSPQATPKPSGPGFGPPAMLYPTFAPNGKTVAFLVGQDLLGLTQMWLGDGDLPEMGRLATFFPISWSPDGRRIAGTAYINPADGGDPNSEIMLVDYGAKSSVRITHRSGFDVSPSWSPDGSSIAFLQDRGADTTALMTMDTEGSHQRTLLTFDGYVETGAQPAWSPDGSRIAISQTLEGNPAMVHLVDAHTSRYTTVVVRGRTTCTDLTWSPTGTRIAFICLKADQDDPEGFVASADGGDPVRLAAGAHLDWGGLP